MTARCAGRCSAMAFTCLISRRRGARAGRDVEGARRRGARRSDHQRDHRLPARHLSAAARAIPLGREPSRHARTGFSQDTPIEVRTVLAAQEARHPGPPRPEPASSPSWWRRCSGSARTTRPISARAPQRQPGAAAAEAGRGPAARRTAGTAAVDSAPQPPATAPADGARRRRRPPAAKAPPSETRARPRRRRPTLTIWRPTPFRQRRARRGRRARPSSTARRPHAASAHSERHRSPPRPSAAGDHQARRGPSRQARTSPTSRRGQGDRSRKILTPRWRRRSSDAAGLRASEFRACA